MEPAISWIKNNKIGIIALFALAAGAGYLIFADIRSRTAGDFSSREPSSPSADVDISATGGEYQIEKLPVTETGSPLPPPPALDRPVVFSTNVSAEAKRIISSNIAEFIGKLRDDPRAAGDWISLGVQFKVAGDFAQAKSAWEYAALLAPSDYVAFNNLGDLHANYLKDYPKAEVYFRKSIDANPHIIGSYRALAELYRFLHTAKASLAPQVLKEGLIKNPKSTDLMILLAQYYRDSGEKASARAYYEQALAEARAQKNAPLAALLEEELKRF